MSATKYLNVFTGPDSLRDYYNPDLQPPLPLVEIPQSLNPFIQDGVRIYAKMMSTLPANNVKALPALNMLQHGVTPATKTIVEYSSGSTVISMSIIARVLYGIPDVRAYLSNKTTLSKLQLMRFFGLNITLFGGPSQPEPTDLRGGICRAEKIASERDDVLNPNQYENDLNWKAHVRWTGPQIMAQLPQINVFCAGMGTSGTMTGIGTYLKEAKPSITRIGVCTAPGDCVPGPRSHALLSPVKFPWRSAIDVIEEVGSSDSYRLSLALSREGLICGPSSGFNLQGLYNFISREKEAGTLDRLRGEDGQIHGVFICCDLPYQYLDDYFTKLGEDYFHPLVNENLRHVDLYRYDEAWELPASTILTILYGPTALSLPASSLVSSSPKKYASPRLIPLVPTPPSTPPPSEPSDTISSPKPPSPQLHLQPSTILIDLRSPSSFTTAHLPSALHMPLSSLPSASTPSPFAEPAVLERQWKEISELFSDSDEEMAGRVGEWKEEGKDVVLVCYGGDTARVASSVLRAQGIKAWSLRGGMEGLGANC